jgi:hypothetical protein
VLPSLIERPASLTKPYLSKGGECLHPQSAYGVPDGRGLTNGLVDTIYAGNTVPAAGHIGVLTIEDPYSEASRVDSAGNLDVSARLESVRHADDTLAEGAPAWSPPSRPLMTVIRALRDDPVGRMHNRHQIDEAQYKAARAFQQAADEPTRQSSGPSGRLIWPKQKSAARIVETALEARGEFLGRPVLAVLLRRPVILRGSAPGPLAVAADPRRPAFAAVPPRLVWSALVPPSGSRDSGLREGTKVV